MTPARRAATALAWALLAPLASCAPKAPATATPAAEPAPDPIFTPPDARADLAAADQTPLDQPNFRVCLAAVLDARDPAALTIPAGALFESWGKKNGQERNPVLDAEMLRAGAIRYVVVLRRPLTLSRQQPCGETVAQTAHSDLFEWRRPLVRKALDLQFQVIGVENHMAWPLTDRLGGVIKLGQIFGYPTADIGHPRQMKEEN